MKLEYRKECDEEVMQDILMLNPLYDDFEKISMSVYDGIKSNIIIETKRHFYSHEKDSITASVDSYSEQHPLRVRKLLEDKVSRPAIVLGNDIISKYAAMNLYKDKTALQIIEVMQISQNLLSFLMTGSLELALYELSQIRQNLPESQSITAEECDEFIRRLQVGIASLKGV